MKTKKILTYTYLTDLMKRLHQEGDIRVNEFYGSKGAGQWVTNHKDISVRASESNQYFILYRVSKRELYPFCQIEPIIISGKVYSFYRFNCASTRFRKSMTNCMPVELPEGIKFDSDRPAQFLNADGSFETGGRYFDNGERRPFGKTKGKFSVKLGIDDATGKHFPVPGEHVSCRRPWAYADIRTGFLPGSCRSVKEWLDSMDYKNNEIGVSNCHWEFVHGEGHEFHGRSEDPLWDTEAMRDVATRALRSAKEFMKHAPHVKAVIYPGCFITASTPSHLRRKRFETGSDDTGNDVDWVTVGHDQDGDPIRWRCPELVLWWTVASNDIQKKPVFLRWIKVTIPPVGCGYLDKDCYQSSVRSEFLCGNLRDSYHRAHFIKNTRVSARAYHQLQTRTERSVRNPWYTTRTHFHAENEEAGYFTWSRNSTVVCVSDCHDLGLGYKMEHPYATNYATSPETAFSLYEEAEILESLPAC